MSLKTKLNNVEKISDLYGLVKEMKMQIGFLGGRRCKVEKTKGTVSLNDIALKFQDLSISNTDNASKINATEIVGIFEKINELDEKKTSGLRGILTKIKRQFGKLFFYRGFNRETALNTIIQKSSSSEIKSILKTIATIIEAKHLEEMVEELVKNKETLTYRQFTQVFSDIKITTNREAIAFLKIANVLYEYFLKDKSKPNISITTKIEYIMNIVVSHGTHGDHINIFHQDQGKDIVDKACTDDFKRYLITNFFKNDKYPFNEYFFKKNNYKTWVETQVPSAKERGKGMDAFFAIYNPRCRPNANMKVLKNYYGSDKFDDHAQAAKIYYNSDQLDIKDAVTIMNRREPVNIEMDQHYDKEALKEKYGYECSVYNDPEAKKVSGESFSDKPNTVCVYSETYLWPTPGDDKVKHEIACLSVPAPALDTAKQPHYAYYVNKTPSGSIALNQQKYKKEMEHLAKTIVKCAIESKKTAFGGKGIKRLVISRYGQVNFLDSLKNHDDKKAAHSIFYQSLVAEIEKEAENLKGIEIVMSELHDNSNNVMDKEFVNKLKDTGLKVGLINGDILKTARTGDLIINAWDPHSVPGNGNDADPSFDGAMGKCSGIGVTGIPQLNPYLKDLNRYVEV